MLKPFRYRETVFLMLYAKKFIEKHKKTHSKLIRFKIIGFNYPILKILNSTELK